MLPPPPQLPLVPVLELELELEDSKIAAFRSGTYRNLAVHLSSYLVFCEQFNKDPLRLTQHNLMLYIQYLSRRLRSVYSIRNYLCGLKKVFGWGNIKQPKWYTSKITDLLRGIKRRLKHKIRRARPVTTKMLQKMYTYIDHEDPFQATIWAILVTMFFTALRKSNIVPPTVQQWETSGILRRRDIKIKQNSAKIRVGWTKTIQTREEIFYFPLRRIQGSTLCPVTALQNMVTLNPRQPRDPAFCWDDGRPISYKILNGALKSLVHDIGMNSKCYSTHSLRRGSTMHAYNCGVPEMWIKALGTWKSNAYQNYIDTGSQARKNAFLIMTQDIN